ncbi:MAG: hypothetical protein IPH33_06010 [Bacteroidetes bacterium]|nr:hypothetical protein [Bacteroidota bacterium]
MLYFFTDLKGKQILTYASGFVAMALFYLVMRNTFVPFTNVAANPEIINNAFFESFGIGSNCNKILRVVTIY